MADSASKTRVWAPRALAALFLTSGVVHLVKPDFYTPLVPRSLPAATGLVYGSGVAELVCGAALLARTRWAGPLSAAVLVAVFPGNVQMALDVTSDAGPDDTAKVVAVWGRIPLQIPMIWAAFQNEPRR
jgi:uncharacterized membrane protein